MSNEKKFPAKPEEIPQISSAWEELSTFQKVQEAANFTELEIAKTLFVDKIRVLNALAVIQVSIVYRAVRACDLYFRMMERTKSTDSQTYIRPRVRFNKKYSTVEMAWVRRLSKSKPSNPDMPFKKSDNEKIGRSFSIRTEDGVLDVLAWYQYIKKGDKDRYPDSIFKKEPAWAQKLGSEVEDKFELLRKEQKTLSYIRRLISSIDGLQMKHFNEMIQAELDKWTEGHPLKSQYNPNINLDGSSEE